MKPKPPIGVIVLLLVIVAFVLRVAWNERNQSYQKAVEKMHAEINPSTKTILHFEQSADGTWTKGPSVESNHGWGGNPTNSPICDK